MAFVMKNSYGDIAVETDVVGQIAGIAATNCYGVVGMISQNKKGGLYNLLKREILDKGVRVTCVDRELVIDLYIVLEYGVNIKTIGDSIKNNVKYQVETLTGLKVASVRVNVEGIRVD